MFGRQTDRSVTDTKENRMPRASMLHLHELQVLGCVYVVEREAGRLWEKWLITKTMCDMPGACGALSFHIGSGRGGRVKTG